MSSIFTPELTAALVAHNRLYDVKEFAKAADALLAEGLALLRAHAGEGDVINRYVATVEKVRAQYRAAKEAPAPAPDVAPPGFRIVGRSGPGVPAPFPGGWVAYARNVDGSAAGLIPRPACESDGNQYDSHWNAGCYDVLEPIPAPAPEPSAPPRCEPWCGGELCPGTGSEFCKCLDVDRYFCTKACQAAEQPMRPCQPVPAHEAWMLRRMANSWREHADQVAAGLASRFGQPSAPPAGVPTCKVWCGTERDEPGCLNYCTNECGIAGRPLNPPPSAPVTVATGGVPVHGCKERRAMSGLTFNAFAAVNRKRCEVDFHRTLDDTNDHTVETWALKLLEEAGEVAQAVLRFGGKSARKSRTTEQDIGDEISDVVSYCALLANRLGLDFEQTVIRKWNAVSERVGSVLRIEAAIQETGGVPTGFRLGAGWTAGRECHPGSYTSVYCDDPHSLPATYVKRDGTGIINGACAAHAIPMGALVPIAPARSVPPGPVRDSIDALWYAAHGAPIGPEPVKAGPSETLSDLLRWQPTAAEVQAAYKPAAPASEPRPGGGVRATVPASEPAVRPLSGACECGSDECCTACEPENVEAWKERAAALEAELAEAKGDVDQMRVQLAGVSVAALGGTSEPVIAHRGQWGWSVAYQDTLYLRLRYDAARAEVEQLRGMVVSMSNEVLRLTNVVAHHGMEVADAQADAIKAAVDKANNRAADAFVAWDRRDESSPTGTMSAGEFVEWLRSSEDAPGAVTPAKGGE